MTPELQAALDELTEVTRSATEENTRRLDRLEADINLKALDPSGRLGGLSGFPDSGGRQAFNKFLRNGREALEPHEAKNLVLSDDTRGGYLAPPEFVAEVLKDIVQFSPVRQAARVGQTAYAKARQPQVPGRRGYDAGKRAGKRKRKES